jgi:hypothetical protein
LPTRLALLAPLVACLALPGRAHAAGACPPIAGGGETLARQDPEARLAYIRARMAHDARRARQWSFAFAGSYAALTAGLYVGAGSSIVGFGLIAVSPLKVIFDHEALEAKIAAAGPGGDRCAMLAAAETMLIADAKNEAFGRSWLIHSGNALIGVAALLVLGLGYQRWESGIINGVASIAVGEVMILTQPHGLVRDLRSYRAGDLREPQRRRRRVSFGAAPTLTGHSYGLALVGRF